MFVHFLFGANLFSRLASVIFFANHLAVFGDGFPTIVPGGDVVGLHFFNLKVSITANSIPCDTDAFLSFVDRTLYLVIKCAK